MTYFIIIADTDKSLSVIDISLQENLFALLSLPSLKKTSRA